MSRVFVSLGPFWLIWRPPETTDFGLVNGRTYEWDDQGRLTAVVVGTQRSEFSYNGASQRTKITEFTDGTRVVCRSSSPSLLSGVRQLSAPPPEAAPAGRVLLDCLQRRAAQLLQGEAQEILLQHLSEGRVVPGRQPIWEIREGLLLHQDHPSGSDSSHQLQSRKPGA